MKVLKNVWYVAGWADELAEGRSVNRTIAGEPLLIFQDGDGAIAALLDRCPHRFAPLSRGWVDGGRVQCAYHGLVFDRAGVCVANPHGPVVKALRVPSFPVEARYGALWVWLGDPDLADTDDIPDFSPVADGDPAAVIRGYFPAEANHQLIVDNLLDLSHADYLHSALSDAAMKKGGPGAIEPRYPDPPSVTNLGDRLLVQWGSENRPAIEFWSRELKDPEADADMYSEVLWHPNGTMLLTTGVTLSGTPRAAGAVSHGLHAITPEIGERSHYFFWITRNYRIDDAAFHAAMSAALTHAFAMEDAPMIEAQQARIRPHDLMELGPVLLGIDAAPVLARRIYAQRLAGESTGHVPRGEAAAL